jgi:hypothetical protein
MARKDFEEIWNFYRRFVDRSAEDFIAKLAKTDEIVCVRDSAGALVAFWATSYVDLHRNGVHHRVIYSGWAGADPSVRGLGLIQVGGLSSVVRQRLRYPSAKLYWFFTASTVNSYRLMASTLPEYYPRPDQPMPAELKELYAAAAEQLGSDNWNLERGVVERNYDVVYREGVVPTGRGVRLDPVDEVYAQLNPHQSRGDSLLCICPLHAQNVRAVMARVMRRRKSGRTEPLRAPAMAGMVELVREVRASTMPPPGFAGS